VKSATRRQTLVLQSSSGKLIVDLIRGKTYLLVCQLEDPQGMPRHNVLGMYKMFRVE